MNNTDLIKIVEDQGKIGIRYHIYKTGLIPNEISITKFNKAKWINFKNFVEKKFSWNKNQRLGFQYHIPDNDYSIYVLHLDCGITISANSLQNTAKIIFNDGGDQKILVKLKRRFLEIKERKSSHSIGVIQSNVRNLFVDFCEYKLHKNDLIEHMGDGINQFRDNMVENLRSDFGRGLYLLHGQTGTGKTSFIKNVLSKVDKKVLFISPAFTEELTSPKLISLLMEYPNSILVIEDAESIIMERKADNSGAVSNLLNLTDGFLSDFLNLKIICTFNTNIESIDSALLRDGRLKGMHEFKKLNPKQVQKIASILQRKIPEKPMTIAEVCNLNNTNENYHSKKIGFIN